MDAVGTIVTGDAVINIPLIVDDYSCDNNIVTFSSTVDASMTVSNWQSSLPGQIFEALFDDSKLRINLSGRATYDDVNSTLTIADKTFSVQ